MSAGGPDPRPLLSVVRGEPSPEQLAALVAGLVTRAGPPAASAPPAPRRWRTPLRPALPPPGPGAWQASALLR